VGRGRFCHSGSSDLREENTLAVNTPCKVQRRKVLSLNPLSLKLNSTLRRKKDHSQQANSARHTNIRAKKSCNVGNPEEELTRTKQNLQTGTHIKSFVYTSKSSQAPSIQIVRASGSQVCD